MLEAWQLLPLQLVMHVLLLLPQAITHQPLLLLLLLLLVLLLLLHLVLNRSLAMPQVLQLWLLLCSHPA
jgi:hypothetical protein